MNDECILAFLHVSVPKSLHNNVDAFHHFISVFRYWQPRHHVPVHQAVFLCNTGAVIVGAVIACYIKSPSQGCWHRHSCHAGVHPRVSPPCVRLQLARMVFEGSKAAY